MEFTPTHFFRQRSRPPMHWPKTMATYKTKHVVSTRSHYAVETRQIGSVARRTTCVKVRLKCELSHFSIIQRAICNHTKSNVLTNYYNSQSNNTIGRNLTQSRPDCRQVLPTQTATIRTFPMHLHTLPAVFWGEHTEITQQGLSGTRYGPLVTIVRARGQISKPPAGQRTHTLPPATLASQLNNKNHRLSKLSGGPH